MLANKFVLNFRKNFPFSKFFLDFRIADEGLWTWIRFALKMNFSKNIRVYLKKSSQKVTKAQVTYCYGKN